MRALLRGGATCDDRDIFENTPLHLAVDHGHCTAIRLLLEHTANVNSTDCAGRTPLHIAATVGQVDLVAMLLANGADVDARDALEFVTPMQLAAKSAHAAVVQILSHDAGGAAGPRCTGQTCAPFSCHVVSMLVAPCLALANHQVQSARRPVQPKPSLPAGLPLDGDPSAEICSICLGALRAAGPGLTYDGSTRVLMCNHRFHSSCIGDWLLRQPVCPLCKITIDDIGNTITSV